jgi:hypothetical protein|tara:strand:+ start:1099 stop:1311 length:213 start_codon:yes stop_codon:yes gene_type:complete
MRNYFSDDKTYPTPGKQKVGVQPSLPEPSNEGFASPTALKEKTVDIPGKSVKTKGTGAATKGLDFISYIN